MKKEILALGGRAALEQPGTLMLKGTCEASNPEENGPVEIAIQSPGVAFHLGGDDGLRVWLDGDQLWRSERDSGVQKLPAKQFSSVVAVFDQSRVLHWKELFPEIRPVRVATVDGREAWVLETLPGDAATQRLYLDRESARVVRAEVPPGLTFTFSDYRPANGLQVPHRIQQTTSAGDIYTFHFSDVKRTGDTDDARFHPK